MKPVDTTEVRKASFWVNQIFVLFATVIGVYLASSQGFKQAVAYEKLMSDKSSYYLRLSLRSELADNVQLVKAYAAKLKTGGFAARKEPFRLDTFVWDSMKFSPSALETPSVLLTGSRNFYRNVADIQAKVADNTYGVENAIKLLNGLTDNMEKEILPLFDTDIKELRDLLDKNKIDVRDARESAQPSDSAL